MEQVARNRPASTSSRKSRLVAASSAHRPANCGHRQRVEYRHTAHPQQLGLQCQRQLADLIEKHVPLSAISNFPLRLLIAPVNALSHARTTHFPPHFPAVRHSEIDQRIHRPWRGFMNRFRHHSLPVPVSPLIKTLRSDAATTQSLFSIASCQGTNQSSASVHRFKRRSIAWQHILAFQLFNSNALLNAPAASAAIRRNSSC